MRSFELTGSAENDLTEIWLYTYETWGLEQADKYYDGIVQGCNAIGEGTAHAKRVEGLTDDIHVLRCQHHYIFFLPLERPVVLAVLHERMDVLRRLAGRL